MDFLLQSDRPIYIQLVEQIERSVASGQYKPGERLPPVRDMAAQAGVNPNTMQKALSELERKGLVFTQRTSGRYITEDETMVAHLCKELARLQAVGFLKRMNSLGYTRGGTMELLETISEGEEPQ